MKRLGWLFIVVGLLFLISPFVWNQILGHNSGLLGLLLVFVGITLLKKRKDQLD